MAPNPIFSPTFASPGLAASVFISFIDLDSCYHFKTDPVIGGMIFDDKIGGLLNLPDAVGHGAFFNESDLDQKSKVTI